MRVLKLTEVIYKQLPDAPGHWWSYVKGGWQLYLIEEQNGVFGRKVSRPIRMGIGRRWPRKPDGQGGYIRKRPSSRAKHKEKFHACLEGCWVQAIQPPDPPEEFSKK